MIQRIRQLFCPHRYTETVERFIMYKGTKLPGLAGYRRTSTRCLKCGRLMGYKQIAEFK